jgi:hypothetical protein
MARTADGMAGSLLRKAYLASRIPRRSRASGADYSNGQLNVFSPAGLALPGAKRGERIRFMAPGGDEKALKGPADPVSA